MDNLILESYNNVRSLLRKDRLYRRARIDNNSIFIHFKTQELWSMALTLIRAELPRLTVSKIRDNNNEIVVQLNISNNALLKSVVEATEKNTHVLINRIKELGLLQPVVKKVSDKLVSIQLNGIQDITRIKEILGAYVTLEFRLVDMRNDPHAAIQSGKIPIGSMLYYFRDGRPLLLKTRVIATGENITSASSGIDRYSNIPMIDITLDSAGGRAMLDTTKKYLHHRIAVVFIENKVETVLEDGKIVKKRSTTKDVISAATIQGTFSSRFQITGIDSTREARNIALLLRAGQLSVPMEIIDEYTIESK